MTHNPYESPSTDGGTSSPTLREQTPVRRWSFALTCVLVNFAIWQIGVFFNSFGGAIDQLGASLCILTWFVAPLLIVGALIYSPFRRFGLPIQTWDFYGPAMSILAYVIMNWQMHMGTRY